MAQSEVFEDEILSRLENTDNPTEEMPEQRDHGKNITRTSSIEPLANLLILRLQNVLTMDSGKQHRHDAVNEQQKTLNAKLRGHYQYYGRRTNFRAIRQFYHRVRRIWREWLSRRARGQQLTWERFKEILRQYPLLRPRITHAWAGAGSHA